jgi:hypothetical protein
VDACNPLLQAHPTWARDKHEGRRFPLLRLSPSGFFPPSRSVSCRPIWAGARGDNLLVGPGTPRVRNADNIQHLLCTCIFARQFWYYILSSLGMANLSPASNESAFANWWAKVSKQVHKSKRRGFNSIIILRAWCLWLHRNKAVFYGVSPSINGIKIIFWMKLNTGGLPVLDILRLWFLVL